MRAWDLLAETKGRTIEASEMISRVLKLLRQRLSLSGRLLFVSPFAQTQNRTARAQKSGSPGFCT